MNNICEFCSQTFGEGHICRNCRENFKFLSVDDDKFNTCLNCQECDKYWFPCRTCAKEAFYYNLGKGNNSEEKGYTFEHLLLILESKSPTYSNDNQKSYCVLQ